MIMISSARILPHHTDGLDEDQPRAEESSDEEHAEGTALRYAAAAFVWFAKAPRQAVDKHDVLPKSLIGIKQSSWNAHGPQDGIQQGATNLVEAFPDVRRGAQKGGILGPKSREARKNSIDLPRG